MRIAGGLLDRSQTRESAEETDSLETNVILHFLAEHPHSSSNAIVKGVGKNKDATLERLRRLHQNRQVAFETRGRATLWRVTASP